MEITTPARRVQRVRHELHRREVDVARVQGLSPGFVAVTFAGASLTDFVSASFDDHVKFIFHPAAADVAADAELQCEPVRRDYTPRHFDRQRCELTLEFALHGDGQASLWARGARPGQRAVIAGPRGSMIIPADYDWHLLVGDATALPAIHRRLEELPAGVKAIVVLQLPDPADRRSFSTAAQLDLQWVGSDEALLAAVGALRLPAGEGYAWAAGEASVMARLRQMLVHDKQHASEAMRVAAYWKRGIADHHENLGR